MNPKKIVIDGKTYSSVEEMPEDVRQKYELALQALSDTNGNHVPDVLENILLDEDKDGQPDILKNVGVTTHVTSHMKIIVNGKEFNRMEDLPPEARAKYEAALGKLDANKNGIPDFVEGMMKISGQDQAATSSNAFPVETPPQSAAVPVSPAIAPETSNGLMLVLAGIFVFLFCVLAGGAVWYFFLR